MSMNPGEMDDEAREGYQEILKQFGFQKRLENDDPRLYPRSVRITDDEAIMLLTQAGVTMDKLEDLKEQMGICRSELELTAQKLYRKLKQLYPDIPSKNRPGQTKLDSGVGIRKWEDGDYFVGWDSTRDIKKPSEFE